jgi:hypothetical protein
MANPSLRIAATAVLTAAITAATTAPCLAESFASSASSAGSSASGSVSDSVKGSSKSSSGETKVADGDYQVIEVTALADRPGMLQLTLQATAHPGEQGALWLTLPRQALAQRMLAAGDVVSARARPYGVEFARADSKQAFFLLLAGAWANDIEPHAVTL